MMMMMPVCYNEQRERERERHKQRASPPSQVHHGIKGMVYDENNNPIKNAEIAVSGVDHDVTSGQWVFPLGRLGNATSRRWFFKD